MRLQFLVLVVVLYSAVYGDRHPKCDAWSRKFDLCLSRGFQPRIFTECKATDEDKRQDYCIRFERFLKNPRYECNYICGFSPVQRTVKVNFSKQKSLEVRTNSENGSQDKMYMYFQDENEEWAGAFLVLFSRNPSYQIGWCYQKWQVLPGNLPEEQEKLWRITRTPKGIRVTCNGVEILNEELRDDICDRTNLKKPWHVYWDREISQFYFPSGDTASLKYRVTGLVEEDIIDDVEEEIGRLCTADEPKCPRDPCRGKVCPRFPNAKCVPNLCGCSVTFMHKDGNPVQDCNEPECDENTPIVTCQGNPCDEATCPNRPDAYCSVNLCGDCTAVFTDADGNEVNDCHNEKDDGDYDGHGDDGDDHESEMVSVDPVMCESCTDVFAVMPGGGESKMPSFEKDTNACGGDVMTECATGLTCGTHTMTYSMDSLKIKVVSKGCIFPHLTCETLVKMSGAQMAGNMKFEECEMEITKQLPESNMCPEGVPIVTCFANPCDVSSCSSNPDATCVPNYCGACNAFYYDAEGSLIEDCVAVS